MSSAGRMTGRRTEWGCILQPITKIRWKMWKYFRWTKAKRVTRLGFHLLGISEEPRSKLRGNRRQSHTNLGGVDPHGAA